VFEGSFEDTNEDQMVSCFSNEVGHRLRLQGPLNYLSGERRASYTATMPRRILDFCHV
jgi:hypothetical protein